jgi:hypothetical protein
LRFNCAEVFQRGKDLKHLDGNIQIYYNELYKLIWNFNPIITIFDIQRKYGTVWKANITELYFETEYLQNTFANFFKLKKTPNSDTYKYDIGKNHSVDILSLESNWDVKDITELKTKHKGISLQVYSPITTHEESLIFRDNWFKQLNS